jgi:uncharacterized damage-inducible protein DinB
MASTRRLLERVPGDKGQWKPHDKSFPLGHLAQLVALMPGWITHTLLKPDIDLASGGGYTYEETATLLALFDRNVKEAREALSKVIGEELDAPWSLKKAGEILFTLPRRVVVRQHLSHFVHHRGQLTVYLRLLDVPIPSIYGPTADEGW